MPAAVASIKNSSSEWAYNLRSWAFHDEDGSDSDDNQPPAPSQPAVSEDAKLLASLDIAGRQDEAAYKPNPWSIAKANAASRPQPDASKANQPIKDTGGPKEKPQGRIVDFLKKQAEAPPAPDGKGLRPGLPPRTGNQPSARPKVNLLAPSVRDVPVNHSLVRACEQLSPPIPNGPTAALPAANLPCASSLVSDRGSSSVCSNITPADRSLALPCPPTAHIRPPKLHTSTFDSSLRSDLLLAPPGNAFASIPDPAPAFYSSPPPSHRPNFTDFAAYANSRRVPAGSSAQSHNAASPERLSDARVSANACSGRVDASILVSPARNSSPVSPHVVPHGFPLVPPQPSSRSPATPHEYATPVSQRKRQRVPLPVFKSFSSPPGQLSGFAQAAHSRPNSAYIHPHRSQQVPPPGPSPRRRHVRDGRFGPYRRSVEPDQNFNPTTAVMALASPPPYADGHENESPSRLDPDADYGHIHPARYSNRLPQARGSTPSARAPQDLLVHVPRSSPHVATPRAETIRTIDHSQQRLPKRRRPSPTPSPSPSPPAPTSTSRPNASASRSAYAHPSLAPEQDEAWSTLQPRSAAGKTAKKDKSGIKSSGKFRVPLLLRGPARGAPEGSEVGNKDGQTAAKKPRVVLYRPPPRAAQALEPSMEHDNSLYTVRGGDVPTTSSRGGDDSTPDPEPSAGFDVERVESRYAGVRYKMKKRRHASSGVWDLLQLPSCGLVYVDLDDDEGRRSVLDAEIEIVRWDGQEEALVWDPAS